MFNVLAPLRGVGLWVFILWLWARPESLSHSSQPDTCHIFWSSGGTEPKTSVIQDSGGRWVWLMPFICMVINGKHLQCCDLDTKVANWEVWKSSNKVDVQNLLFFLNANRTHGSQTWLIFVNIGKYSQVFITVSLCLCNQWQEKKLWDA